MEVYLTIATITGIVTHGLLVLSLIGYGLLYMYARYMGYGG